MGRRLILRGETTTSPHLSLQRTKMMGDQLALCEYTDGGSHPGRNNAVYAEGQCYPRTNKCEKAKKTFRPEIIRRFPTVRATRVCNSVPIGGMKTRNPVSFRMRPMTRIRGCGWRCLEKVGSGDASGALLARALLTSRPLGEEQSAAVAARGGQGFPKSALGRRRAVGRGMKEREKTANTIHSSALFPPPPLLATPALGKGEIRGRVPGAITLAAPFIPRPGKKERTLQGWHIGMPALFDSIPGSFQNANVPTIRHYAGI